MSMALVWDKNPVLDSWIEEGLAHYADGSTIDEAVDRIEVDAAALSADELDECIRVRLRASLAHRISRMRTTITVSERDLKERADARLAQLLGAVDVLQRVRYDGIPLEMMTAEQLAWHRDRTASNAHSFTTQSGWFADAVKTLESTETHNIHSLKAAERDRLRTSAEEVW